MVVLCILHSHCLIVVKSTTYSGCSNHADNYIQSLLLNKTVTLTPSYCPLSATDKLHCTILKARALLLGACNHRYHNHHIVLLLLVTHKICTDHQPLHTYQHSCVHLQRGQTHRGRSSWIHQESYYTCDHNHHCQLHTHSHLNSDSNNPTSNSYYSLPCTMAIACYVNTRNMSRIFLSLLNTLWAVYASPAIITLTHSRVHTDSIHTGSAPSFSRYKWLWVSSQACGSISHKQHILF